MQNFKQTLYLFAECSNEFVKSYNIIPTLKTQQLIDFEIHLNLQQC